MDIGSVMLLVRNIETNLFLVLNVCRRPNATIQATIHCMKWATAVASQHVIHILSQFVREYCKKQKKTINKIAICARTKCENETKKTKTRNETERKRKRTNYGSHKLVRCFVIPWTTLRTHETIMPISIGIDRAGFAFNIDDVLLHVYSAVYF